MDIEELKRHVGAEAYREAARAARETAAATGRRGGGLDSDVPHELSSVVWESDLPCTEKVELAFRLYEDVPSYAVLMYVKLWFGDLDPECREQVWKRYAKYLDQEDETLAEPVAYSLWCNFFEDSDTVRMAWERLSRGAPPRRLRRLLAVAGPVPWRLKAPLYERLVGRREWHPDLFRSLLHSRFDALGEIDVREARALLRRLRLPPDTEHLDRLRTALEP